MGRKMMAAVLITLAALITITNQGCIHDHFAANATYHYYDDLSQNERLYHKTASSRLLQTTTTTTTTLAADSTSLGTSTMNKIRIYADYSFIQTGGQTQKNQIKRLVNITANYFYNVLQVNRLSRLFYPSDSPLQCNILTVPSTYVTTGVIGDIGILVTNQINTFQYIAKSTACALLKSNNRPIWGVMVWNNNYLQYDQVGFQKLVYVSIHQMTHILGYSAAMYDKYPAGNPYRNDSRGQYLTSPLIIQQMNAYFGCNSSYGLILQDQDGTLIPSHSQRRVFGNEYMIASGKKGAYFSRTSVALFNSMGWYNMTYDYAQPAIWGKNRGCTFYNINNCVFPQFCSGTDFGCDWDVTAMGQCNIDNFAGSCRLVNYFTNTICIDENYEIKNLNANLLAQERGGYNSRCFSSTYRQTGLAASVLNNRCYVTVCSASRSYLYILVGQNVIVCTSSNMGNNIGAPSGMDGTLRCPTSFSNYCDIKKTCTYGCNKNGACINGQCLCTGATTLTSTCLDVTLSTTQMDTTSGLINSIIISKGDMLILTNSKVTKSKQVNDAIDKIITKALNSGGEIRPTYAGSINTKAQRGTYLDPEFGDIVLCEKKFGCLDCNRFGCLNCPVGTTKNEGKCLAPRRL